MCEVYEKAFAWLLRDIRPVKPFPVSGQLGIFDVDVAPSLLVPAPEFRPALGLFEEPYGPQTRKKL
jgi:hypothetical protein